MRTVKRYSNRKLYDTESKRYITLEGIAELVRAGNDVQVIENDTGEDLTAVTLSQIIFEQQKRGSPAPLRFFTNLIRFGNHSPLETLRRSWLVPQNLLSTIESEVERRLQELVEQGEMAEEQMRKLQGELMGRFRTGTLGPRDQDLFKSMNIPTQQDLQDVAERIDGLNDRLAELVEATRQEGRRNRSEETPLEESAGP